MFTLMYLLKTKTKLDSLANETKTSIHINNLVPQTKETQNYEFVTILNTQFILQSRKI